MKTKMNFTKTMLLLFTIVSTSFATFAQNNSCPNNLLINGNFNSATCGTFAPGCVPNWTGEQGSPNIFDLSNNPYAWMWSYGGSGEAISAIFPFLNGVTYNISFRVLTNDINTGCAIVANPATTINLVATNNAHPNMTATPSTYGDIIFKGPASPYLAANTNNLWTTVTVQYTPTANFSKLWIFPFMQQPSGGLCQVEMCIDDICIRKANLDGAYCCDSINLVTNGNFESGNIGFGSDYTNDPAVYPGNYSVATSAAPFNANITDHSYCENSNLYSSNDQFLLVNGHTQQSVGNAKAVIWEQTISGLDTNSTYKFCAYFKNMPQCTFDTIPNVSMEVMGANSPSYSSISAATTACAWINKEINFSTGLNTSVTLQIILDQTGNADGNDLAIDDIAVSKLIDPDLSITVQHQGSPDQIKASVNTINTNDDMVHCADSTYEWRVAEVTSYTSTNISTGIFTIKTAPYWNLTTTFPLYPFDPTKMYMIVLYTPACECYDEGYTFQLTYNNRPMVTQFTEAEELMIIESIRNGTISNGEAISSTDQLNSGSDNLVIYPNPVENSFTISLKGNSLKRVEVVSLTGQTLLSKNYSDGNAEEILDISQLASGIYLVKAYGKDNMQYTTKVVKE